jgi:hypothetical protein
LYRFKSFDRGSSVRLSSPVARTGAGGKLAWPQGFEVLRHDKSAKQNRKWVCRMMPKPSLKLTRLLKQLGATLRPHRTRHAPLCDETGSPEIL